MEFDDRIKLCAFEAPTTYQNDYRLPPKDALKHRKIHKWLCDKEEKGIPEPPKQQKWECHETFTTLKQDHYIPFNLLWTPHAIGYKPVDRKIMEKTHDVDKEHVIKTRPRLYMAPAVSIDDVPDKEMRDLLLDFMYTTDWKNAEREAANFIAETRKPKKNNVCCCRTLQEKQKGEYDFMVSDDPRANVTRKAPDILPAVSHKPDKNYKEWDRKQTIAMVDPTSMFWKNTDDPKNLSATEDLVSKEIKEEIASLIKSNELRIPHDRTIQGYAGYKPAVAANVPLKMTNFTFCHPMVTTSQAITCRYAEDMKK